MLLYLFYVNRCINLGVNFGPALVSVIRQTFKTTDNEIINLWGNIFIGGSSWVLVSLKWR